MTFLNSSGAIFSPNGKERYVLWRRWDISRPNVLFIGLNPSVANEKKDDPTTKRIIAHSKRFGFGGCFLMNCFTQIVTNPKNLKPSGNWKQNLSWLDEVSLKCDTVIFAWGKHRLVKEMGRDVFFKKYFPQAYCLGLNLDGSPKHPLYLPYSGALQRIKKARSNSL